MRATPQLRACLELDDETSLVLFAADDARGIRYPTALRWLGSAGACVLGAALVDGRIVAAVDVAWNTLPGPARASGLLVHASERGETLLLTGLELVALSTTDEAVPLARPVRLFDEIERQMWDLRQSGRSPPSGEIPRFGEEPPSSERRP